MPSAHRRIVAAALFFSTAVFAAEPQRQLDPQAGAPTVVTGGATAEGVRFTAPSQVAQMKVEILSPEGQTVYDSAWRNANVLDWSLADNAGHPLASGAYRARVTVKYLDGGFAVRQAMVRITGDRASFERGENGSIVVEEEPGEARSMMLLAHDGQSGAVVATQGDLAFKFGDFVRGKEAELMRLTAEGKLGIGTDNPQATLDVVGSIRASQGLEFSDGTVQTSGVSGRVDAEGNIMPMVAGTGTVNQVAKWLETGGAGTLGNSAITESGGSVTVGTVASRGQLQIAGNATSDVFAGMGPDLINGPAFNYGYAGFTFGLGAGFFNVRPAAGATGVNPSLRLMTINQERMIITNAGNVGIGTSTPAAKLDVAGTVALSGNLTLPTSTSTAGNILKGGARLLHTFGGVFLGINAGNFTMTGSNNTASGASALFSNTTGSVNTASGVSALQNNTTGFNNTASGVNALASNTTGAHNTASGVSALQNNTTGGTNTASGAQALQSNTSGSSNIAVGVGVGINLTTGNNNIDIGHDGVAGEASTIRIGTAGTHTRAFLAGVRDIGVAGGVPVLVDPAGQLGVAPSSAMIKRDIAGLGEQSSALMKLRPVSFFYRSDAAGIRQYGLIAEEVAEVMPELVQFSPEGEAQTVRYHFLAPLLLSEIQKQQQTIEQQRQTIEQQHKQLAELRKEKDEQITMIEARLATLEEQSRHTANLDQSVAVQQRITEPSGRASE